MPQSDAAHPAEVRLSLDVQQLAAIDRAAERRGQDRAAFIVAAAMRDAAEPMDQTTFFLSDEDYQRFRAKLQAQPPSNETLRGLLHSKDPWTT